MQDAIAPIVIDDSSEKNNCASLRGSLGATVAIASMDGVRTNLQIEPEDVTLLALQLYAEVGVRKLNPDRPSLQFVNAVDVRSTTRPDTMKDADILGQEHHFELHHLSDEKIAAKQLIWLRKVKSTGVWLLDTVLFMRPDAEPLPTVTRGWQERGELNESAESLRRPFRQIVTVCRATDPNFDLSPATMVRLNSLVVSRNRTKVSIDLPTTELPVGTAIGFIHALYSASFGNGEQCFDRVDHHLGFRVKGKLRREKLVGLQIEILTSSRPAYRVVFSEAMRETATGAASNSTNFRIEIELLDGGSRDLLSEAEIDTKEQVALTAANFLAAVDKLNARPASEGGNFIDWLLQKIFADRLALWELVTFTPKRFEQAKEVVSVDFGVGAHCMFEVWISLVGRGSEGKTREKSFVQSMPHLTDKALSRDQARRLRAKMLRIPFNPDIPPQLYFAIYNMRFFWDLSARQKADLAHALEDGDMETVQRLQRTSNSNTGQTVQGLLELLGPVLGRAEDQEAQAE